jgi:hypothetical protein
MSSTPTTYTYTRPMQVHRFIERHLIRQLLLALGEDGWVPFAFDDGEEEAKIPRGGLSRTHAAVWAAFDEVDEGVLWFRHKDGRECWVKLIGGNGESVISDFSRTLTPALERVFLK